MASLGLLICFVVLKQNKSKDQPLSLQSENLTLLVGEKTQNFYIVSDENAVIEIFADDTTLFNITGNELTAIKAGKTKIVIMAYLNGDKAKTTFNLTVENESPSFQITPTTNCSINGLILTMTDNTCQFSIIVFDKLNQSFSPEIINISATNGATISREATGFIIVSENNCVATFEYPELELVINLTVVKN